jgi:hypothetical protein
MAEEIKTKILHSLQAFAQGNLTKNSLALFKALGYATDRQAPLDKPTYSQFKESFISIDSHFNEGKAQVEQWKHVDLLFQLSGSELIKTTDMFDSKAVVIKDDGRKIAIESYLFFVVELESQSYSRSQLSHITREINRLFPMPVMILFKYGSFLTLAVIDRRLHKRDVSKDVLEKVTLIKDVNIGKPHRAHIEILFDLSLDELKENSKEPITNFIALHNAWRKTLNISELNKKFYRQIADWFYWAVSNVEYPLAPNITNKRENASINVIRLLTRIIFVWFLKEKNLVPDGLFDEKEIAAILKDDDLQSEKKWNYYRAILQNLFFATLNQKMNTEKEPNNREWVSEKRASSGYNEDYTIANKYRFPELFKNPDQALQLFSKIPFLNGGLFDCLDRRGNKQKGDIFIDGFTRHTKPQPKVPNMLFFGEKRKVDLSKVFEDKKWSKEEVKGLINILNDYKFTIAENTPIEEEVALDPELLGRIFENLLAANNPETGATVRKATGSFYTPREIVNYMVDESLLAYLQNCLDHDEKDLKISMINESGKSNNQENQGSDNERRLRLLLSYSDESTGFNEEEKDRLITAIHNLKVLDPACGSGAFPMGMLLKTVHVLHKLDPNNAKWQQVQEDAARTIPDPEIQRDTLARIEEAFSPENNYADYGRKLVLIQNCIYGIDIQPIAVQISKLRFFISLLVDQKYNDAKENRGVLSLPNLETKFVAANTLIGIDESIQGSLHNTDIQQLVGKLHNVRKQIFNARSYRNKKELQKQDEQLRKQLGALLDQKTLEAQKVLERQIETLQNQKTISEKNLKEKNLLVGVRKQTEEVIKKIDKQVAELQTKLLDRHIVETNAMRLADWDPYDQNAHADFFDKEWMFGNSEGFDIVIGNPPYIQIQTMEKKYSQILESQSYKTFTKTGDVYCLFMEKGKDILIRHGILSMIVSNSWLQSITFRSARILLTNDLVWVRTLNVSTKIFEAVVDTMVLVARRLSDKNDSVTCPVDLLSEDSIVFSHCLLWKNIPKDGNSINIVASPKRQDLFRSIQNINQPLSTFFNVFNGVKPFEKGKGNPPQTEKIMREKPFVFEGDQPSKKWYPLLRGSLINRYCNKWKSDYWILYGEWLAAPRDYSIFEAPRKIAVRQTGDSLIATIISSGIICRDNLHIILPRTKELKLETLLGLINSKLFDFIYETINPEKGEALAQVKKQHIEQLPISRRVIEEDYDNRPLIILVRRIIAEKKNNLAADTSKLEREIDLLVYQLYNLTLEEVQIIDSTVTEEEWKKS